MQFDNGRHVDNNVLACRLLSLRLGAALVEGPFPDIDRVGQDLVEAADAKSSAGAGPVATLVEPTGDRFDSHRPGLAIPKAIELENEPDGFGFDRVDNEFLLAPGAALFRFLDGVAEWHSRSVVKTLAGILFHGTQNMLGVLAGLVFVEQGDDLAHHHLCGIVTKLLRHRYKSNARLGELADIHFEPERVAEKPAIGMHDDNVIGTVVVGCALDHALKFRPVFLHSGGPGIDIFRNQIPLMRFAIGRNLLALVGDRQVGFRLTAG